MDMKKAGAIGTRPTYDEYDRWIVVIERVVSKHKTAKPADILRDIVFGGLDLITEEDLKILRGEISLSKRELAAASSKFDKKKDKGKPNSTDKNASLRAVEDYERDEDEANRE
jgi:hypothetical protein